MASVYTHSKLFKQRSFYTQQAFTQRSFYTQQAFTHSKRLHTEHLHTAVLLHMASVYTHRNFLHRDAFTHREAFTHSKLLQKKFLHREAFLYIITAGTAAPKPDLDAKATKRPILKHFLKGIYKGKLLAPKLTKSADKSLSQP